MWGVGKDASWDMTEAWKQLEVIKYSLQNMAFGCCIILTWMFKANLILFIYLFFIIFMSMKMGVWMLYFSYISCFSSPSSFTNPCDTQTHRGLSIIYHICVFVSSTRPRDASPEWGLLGSCEPYWPPGLLWWRKTCCWDDVLCLHETGMSEIRWISVFDFFFHQALGVYTYSFSSLLNILCCHFLIQAT